MLISDFNIWHQGLDGGTVWIYLAGTTTPAPVFSDPPCTVPDDNPQILTSEERNGEMGGKFVHPIYTNVAIECRYSSTDETGVQVPPLTTIAGQDASSAFLTRTGGSTSPTLASVLARTIYASDFGAIGNSAATNTATINSAMGIAAAAGGGIVLLPAGTIPINPITLAEGVVLAGADREATILQCSAASKAITVNGDRAGLRRLTLDGVSVVASSVGLYSKAVDETILDDVLIRSIETGVYQKGGRRGRWKNLYIDGCSRGVRGVGDSDAGNGADGDQWSDNEWVGGKVSNCTTSGLEFEYEDRPCVGNSIRSVGFEDNTGTAVKVQGAQITRLDGCWATGNTHLLSIEDDSTSTPNDDNVVDGFVWSNGRMEGGTLTIEDTALNVKLERVHISDVDVTLTAPVNSVVVLDCIEDSKVTIAATGTKWLRRRTIDAGASFGITTDATETKAWGIHLEPGERVAVTARVIGNQQNGSNSAEYILAASAKRAGATLGYDAQTVNFTVGAIVTGQTSGCQARIIGDSDSGTTGTLTVRSIVKGTNGEFIDNEVIKDDAGGTAVANGTLSVPTVSLLGSSTSVRTDREDVSAWAAAFVANGPEFEGHVTGAAATTIEWTWDADVTYG
jgi:hypothetical protein